MIHFEVDGDGRPLVLLHGMMGSAETWRIAGWMPQLHGYRVIRIDARGRGESERSWDPAAYSIRADGEDVVSVLDELGIDVAAVCGWSMGAEIALATATLFPGRVNAVAALGDAPGWVGFADVPPHADHDRAQADRFERDGMRPVIESLMREGRPAWAALIAKADPGALAARLRGMAAPEPLPHRLADMRHRSLFVWAETESPDPPLALPETATVIIIPGVDHVGALERHDVILPALRELVPDEGE
jgi:pimeloyl-ACP methyl ester carboxylesterase